MSEVAIRVEGLSKQYRIGGPQARYKTLRESLIQTVQAPFRRLASVVRGQSSAVSNEMIWALKDVSFEVQRGEVVGIIGRNGAGKTTLLKILSRITEPTEGQAEIHGRVGSLLEVGTGFHPELTGRENIYLSGAILGMKQAEIDRKFDEIVAFAEVERFIDTPVKHYSSGMYVRLAFAVAAHLDPEILLVDEVLAVGDAQFQKKCLGKMESVAGEGRTVLFVSHNMAAVSHLCSSALWLDQGKIVQIGNTESSISAYLQSAHTRSGVDLTGRKDRTGNGCLQFRKVWLVDENGDAVDTVSSGESISVLMEAHSEEPSRNVQVSVIVSNVLGQRLFVLSTHLTGEYFSELPEQATLRCYLPVLPLRADVYYVSLWSSVNGMISDVIDNAFRFSVAPSDFFGSGVSPTTPNYGSFFVEHSWCIAS
jgi:lipopolysaccharide transport system ATP-binding protein